MELLDKNCGPLLLGIDPGTTQSAYALYAVGAKAASLSKKADNLVILNDLKNLSFVADFMVMEQLKAYGHASDSLFFTAMWTGRFISAWLSGDKEGERYTLLPRKTIVAQLCGTVRAKDKDVRMALVDYFTSIGAKQGGGKIPVIGTKKSPGTLFGYSQDRWAALSAAVCWHQFTACDRRERTLRL